MAIVSWETSYPTGTEDRCCFTCGKSNTNPNLFFTEPELFKAKARRNGTVKCLAHSRIMFGYEACGGFADRDTFKWPTLPEDKPNGTI